MDESSASGGGRGKNKRFWTAREDKVLVEALSELVVDPHWKCENGFRSNYMVRLEEIIGKALPGCGLKAMPHIDSRLKTLGAKFRAISTMLNSSGFVWDDSKKMVSVDRAVYDEFCKVLLDSSDDEGVAGSGNVTQTVTSPPSKKMKTEKTSKTKERKRWCWK
ncbi:uncharacterized protein LOC110733352 isoform X2 [Chenopodium quinoa]|nr:uncharacterized protein LOC110733352 isoform X2 [Chenopodium quinoa]XP_021769092.1 uncharacterized protein LOC110733352 isoform X2 [Chenopodium quinoa]XP_021769100.1 uncharacterized protein LOC110733352 isoform X2 [Chenopodium quinoa]